MVVLVNIMKIQIEYILVVDLILQIKDLTHTRTIYYYDMNKNKYFTNLPLTERKYDFPNIFLNKSGTMIHVSSIDTSSWTCKGILYEWMDLRAPNG